MPGWQGFWGGAFSLDRISLTNVRFVMKSFKRGDHVEWNSEAGRVRGTIVKKAVSEISIKGYVHHASTKAPQYIIKSDKSDHMAIHKGDALKLIRTQTMDNSGSSKAGKNKTRN